MVTDAAVGLRAPLVDALAAEASLELCNRSIGSLRKEALGGQVKAAQFKMQPFNFYEKEKASRGRNACYENFLNFHPFASQAYLAYA